MNLKVSASVLAVVALVASVAVAANDDDPMMKEIEKAIIDRELEDNPPPEKMFYVLPTCRDIEGRAEVLVPQSEAWEQMEATRHYPLGSRFRTLGADSAVTLRFGKEFSVVLAGDSSCGTRPQGLGVESRTVVLNGGTITVKVPRTLEKGKFNVVAAGYEVIDLNGDTQYEFTRDADGEVATIRCLTGTVAIKGRHFSVSNMRPSNEIRVRTSPDELFTALYGVSGDPLVKLDQGLEPVRDYETNVINIEHKMLEWKLSPKTAVRIHRAKPAVGETLSVSVMTFDATGELKNRRTFAEGRHELNSREEGPVVKKEKERLARKAAKAAGDAVGKVPEAEEEKGVSKDDDDVRISENDDEDDI